MGGGFSCEKHQPHEFIAAEATGFIRSRQELPSPKIPASLAFIFLQTQKRATEVALFLWITRT
jgi:hypothetical protein